MAITTIKVSKETKDRLEKLKDHHRDSYEDILKKMLEILNVCRVNPEKAKANLVIIDRKNRKLKVRK